MEKKHIITFAGYVGSGKSTAGKAVAKELSYKHHSTGDHMRQMSKDRGLDFIEFNRMIEDTSEESVRVNKILDSRPAEISKNENNVVIDAHVGFHFAPNSFKVYLHIDPEVAADRILQQGRGDESFTSRQDAIDQIVWRADSNQDRYIKLYNVDIRDLSNYDLVINTGLPENPVSVVVEKVITAYKSWLKQ